jgi:hypothetical protein
MSKHRSISRTLLAVASALIAGCSSDSPTGPRATSLSLTAAPAIGLNPTSIHLCYPFSAGSTRCCCYPSTRLKITNVGGGTLTWAATKNRSWFKISSKTGTAPSDMQVSVNDLTGILPRHTYYGSITISGRGASNSPRTIPVSLYRMR